MALCDTTYLSKRDLEPPFVSVVIAVAETERHLGGVETTLIRTCLEPVVGLAFSPFGFGVGFTKNLIADASKHGILQAELGELYVSFAGSRLKVL